QGRDIASAHQPDAVAPAGSGAGLLAGEDYALAGGNKVNDPLTQVALDRPCRNLEAAVRKPILDVPAVLADVVFLAEVTLPLLGRGDAEILVRGGRVGGHHSQQDAARAQYPEH